MTIVRIICTYDGLEAAHALGRVLAAEDYEVEVNHGHVAQANLAAERNDSEAVVLIWSPQAPGAAYILHWRQKVTPTHLIEISLCEALPTYARRFPVIDFSNWKGRRGSAAWRALSERLRTIARASQPARPGTQRAAMALGAVSLLAVGGAVLVRVNESPAQLATAPTEDLAATSAPRFDGLGGPLRYAEPAGIDDPDLRLSPVAPQLSPISATQPRLLEVEDLAPSLHARPAGLFGRIADMAEPLLDRVSGDDTEPQQGP